MTAFKVTPFAPHGILFCTKPIICFLNVRFRQKTAWACNREEGEKDRESVRETRRSKKLFSGHIHEKQYACFRYPWQPYAMNWVWKMHGNTTDTLFMFDSGTECVRLKETVWHYVFVCVQGGEKESKRGRGGKQGPGQLAEILPVSQWVC